MWVFVIMTVCVGFMFEVLEKQSQQKCWTVWKIVFLNDRIINHSVSRIWFRFSCKILENVFFLLKKQKPEKIKEIKDKNFKEL